MTLSKIMEVDLHNPQQLTLALVAIIGAAYLLYKQLRKSESKYPPGPSTLPVLGNLHQVALCGGNIVTFLEKYRKIYGNIYTVELGGVKRVVVSGYDAFHELLEKNADYTSNRTTLTMPKNYTEAAKETPGLFWAEFPHWKTVRSFALDQLRNEGMGKSSLEPKIMEEFHSYVEHFITPSLRQPIDLKESLSLATANVILLLLTGNREEYTDQNFLAWKYFIDESIESDLKAAICRNIPLAQYLPGDLAGFQSNLKSGKFVIERSAAWVEENKKTMDPDNPIGFLDNFLTYSQKLQEKGEDLHCFTDGNAAIAVMQLFGAGMETTATALRWALLYMSVYPEIQEKVHAEIRRVIGQREVVYKDRLNMPYVEAVSLEVFRRSNIVPVALPHKMDKAIQIHGKVIPTGSELMLNMTSVLHDESVFEEPNVFQPMRFLSGDVELKKNRNTAFGMGRRVCLGRDLAKMEFFLFFVSFMQRYNVTYAGERALSLEGIAGFVNAPIPHQLVFTCC